MHILLTRPERSGRSFAQKLRAAGHQTTIAPVLDIRPCGNLPDAGGYDGLLATSANAFRCLPADAALAQWIRRPLFCVGERTAAAARSRGLPKTSVTAAHAGELLSQLPRFRPPPARLCYLAGRDRKPTLEQGLQQAGYEVETQVVYEAVPAPDLAVPGREALHAGTIDAVMHFSRRSAEVFIQLVERAGLAAQAAAAQHICISTDAAHGLDRLGAKTISIAARPDAEAMIEALPRQPPDC